MAQESCTLARFSLFKSLNEEAIRRFDKRCLWRRFEPKTAIVEFDLESTEVYFVATGVVRVSLPSVRRTDVILSDIGPGEFFGELSAIDGRPRSATVTAVTTAIIGQVPAATFREALRESPDVWEQVLQLLTARIRLLDARIAEFSSLGVRDRIHAQLLRLARIRSTQPNEALISPPPGPGGIRSTDKHPSRGRCA